MPDKKASFIEPMLLVRTDRLPEVPQFPERLLITKRWLRLCESQEIRRIHEIYLFGIPPGKFENVSESERNTMVDECFTSIPSTLHLHLLPSVKVRHCLSALTCPRWDFL
jgi:hypothetical protein